jgi:hypothetical protein
MARSRDRTCARAPLVKNAGILGAGEIVVNDQETPWCDQESP